MRGLARQQRDKSETKARHKQDKRETTSETTARQQRVNGEATKDEHWQESGKQRQYIVSGGFVPTHCHTPDLHHPRTHIPLTEYFPFGKPPNSDKKLKQSKTQKTSTMQEDKIDAKVEKDE